MAVLLLLASGGAQAAAFDAFNDYGGVGLLQTPTARVSDPGEFAVGVQTLHPYNQLQFTAQPFRRIETTFRYSEITNRLYGPEDFSGHQSYKDRSFDVKLLLLDESQYLPAVALGVRDLGGTGIFSSEYLVANYRCYDFDFSLGLGWGRLGARGGIRNPFAAISDHFEDRPERSESGSTGGNRLFRGKEIGLFGGVRWQTPLPSLSLTVEVDGNDYKHEFMDNNQDVASPVNVGLSWRPNRYIDTTLAYERGNTVAARISLRTNFNEWRGAPKFLDPPRPTPSAAAPTLPDASATPVAPAGPVRESAPTPPISSARPSPVAGLEPALRKALSAQGITLQALRIDDGRLTVWYTQTRYRKTAETLGRVARTLADTAPADVTDFTLSELRYGFESYRVTLARGDADGLLRGQIAPEALQDRVAITAPAGDTRWDEDRVHRYPDFSWETGPALRQSIGGPDKFYFYQLWWRLGGTLNLTPHWNLSAQVGANLYNNFDELKLESNSVLPHVRSDIAKYLKQGEDNIVRLETNTFFPLGTSLYGRLSGGLFEEMYGGVAGELLYRRFQQPWALSLDVNHVWQRDYDQLFAFRDYDISTGHLTGYYEYRPADLLVKLSYGRYLAGDWGATLDVAKYFRSGAAVGFFVTKTNVSAEDFGEGQFDKGIYLVIPFDFFSARSSRSNMTLSFRPLTRDGGQKVRDGMPLYNATTTVPEFNAGSALPIY
ncbi:YjbH domain-containing protein [Solimonas soli]|uniref:YjbH domain-containing protein n=1 Tax=Solimonas soli TaxID=413479 RepID=UPI0004B7659D|nr:YjbH domain-containing protein [Solimonas soli]